MGPSTYAFLSCSQTTSPISSRCAGTHRERRGAATAQLRGDDQVLLKYRRELDDQLRRTTLTFDPPPERLATDGARYDSG